MRVVFCYHSHLSFGTLHLGAGTRAMISKIIGKTVGKIITLPITIIEETEKAVDEAIKEMEKKT